MSRAAPPLAPPAPAPCYPSFVRSSAACVRSFLFIYCPYSLLRPPSARRVPSRRVLFRSVVSRCFAFYCHSPAYCLFRSPRAARYSRVFYLPLPSIGCIIWCSMYGRDRTPVYIVCCASRRAARLTGFLCVFSRAVALAASVSRRGGQRRVHFKVTCSWQ